DARAAGPSGNALNWSVSGADTGDVSPACQVKGGIGSQTLNCDAVDLGDATTSQSYTVHVVSGTAADGPAFTITNIATAHATNHPDVSDHDSVHVHHPVIDILKTGPATAQAGDEVGYTLTVTNPGQESFADSTVKVTDPICNGAPVTLIGKGGDTSPTSLDPGDVWTYSCSVKTAIADTAIHNTANVVGCDALGKC